MCTIMRYTHPLCNDNVKPEPISGLLSPLGKERPENEANSKQNVTLRTGEKEVLDDHIQAFGSSPLKFDFSFDSFFFHIYG